MYALAAIDWAALGESAASGLVAGTGIVLAFAIGLRALIRSSELRADGRSLGAAVAGAIASLALLVALAAVVVGLAIVTGKSPVG